MALRLSLCRAHAATARRRHIVDDVIVCMCVRCIVAHVNYTVPRQYSRDHVKLGSSVWGMWQHYLRGQTDSSTLCLCVCAFDNIVEGSVLLAAPTRL